MAKPVFHGGKKRLFHRLPRIQASVTLIIASLTIQLVVVNQVCSLPVYNASDSTQDTIRPEKTRKYKLHSTLRLNSMGYFGYSGRVVSDNQSFDGNIIYDRPKWGALLYKVVDLYDHTTPNNFAMAMIYGKIKIGDRVSVTPYAGFVVEQLESIADKDSGFGAIITSQIKASPHISVEHTAILSNMAFTHAGKDWVNRVRVIFDSGHYNLTWAGWHNNNFWDNSNYCSTGLTASYNKIPVSSKLKLNTSITGFKMIETSDEEANPKKDGLLLTIALLIN